MIMSLRISPRRVIFPSEVPRARWREVSSSIVFGTRSPALALHDEEEPLKRRWKYQRLTQPLIIDKDENAEVIKEAISA